MTILHDPVLDGLRSDHGAEPRASIRCVVVVVSELRIGPRRAGDARAG
jgi:hypothetical protein